MKCLLLLIVVGITCCSAKTLPSFIKKCKRADPVPELSKCMTKSAEALRPYLEKGIPEMKFPAIEPMHISRLEINLPGSSAFGFTANLTDVRAYGGKEFHIEELNFDLENRKILLRFTIPKLNVEMFYTFNGKILLFELDSHGKGHVNISKLETKSYAHISFETRNGKQYINVEEDPSSSYIKYEHAQGYFENLFENNKELTDQTNKAINDNVEALEAEVRPLVYHSVRVLFSGLVNTIFRDYSLEELFD